MEMLKMQNTLYLLVDAERLDRLEQHGNLQHVQDIQQEEKWYSTWRYNSLPTLLACRIV